MVVIALQTKPLDSPLIITIPPAINYSRFAKVKTENVKSGAELLYQHGIGYSKKLLFIEI